MQFWTFSSCSVHMSMLCVCARARVCVCVCTHVCAGEALWCQGSSCLKGESLLPFCLWKIGWHCDELIEKAWSDQWTFSISNLLCRFKEYLNWYKFIVLPPLPWLLFSCLHDNPNKHFTHTPLPLQLPQKQVSAPNCWLCFLHILDFFHSYQLNFWLI